MLHQEESSPAMRRLQMHHAIFLKRKMGYSSDKAKRTGINDEVKEKTNKQLDRKEENQPFDDPRRRRRPICELPKYLKKQHGHLVHKPEIIKRARWKQP